MPTRRQLSIHVHQGRPRREMRVNKCGEMVNRQPFTAVVGKVIDRSCSSFTASHSGIPAEKCRRHYYCTWQAGRQSIARYTISYHATKYAEEIRSLNTCS